MYSFLLEYIELSLQHILQSPSNHLSQEDNTLTVLFMGINIRVLEDTQKYNL